VHLSPLAQTGYYNNGGAPALDQSWHRLWLGVAARTALR